MALTAVQVLAKFRDALLAMEEFAEAGGFDEINKSTSASPKKSTPAPSKKSAAPVRASKKVEPVEDDEDESDVPTAEEAATMTVVELRALAKKLGLTEQKVKAGILAELDEMRDEDSDEDDEEEEYEDDDDAVEEEDDEEEYEDDEDGEEADDSDDEEDAEEDDEDESYTREDLEGKPLNELRALAKSLGISAAEYRGKDVEGLIDLIVPDEDDDEEDVDNDEADDDAEELDEEALREMSVQELFKLADELEVAVPAPLKKMKSDRTKRTTLKNRLVDLILDSAGEDE